MINIRHSIHRFLVSRWGNRLAGDTLRGTTARACFTVPSRTSVSSSWSSASRGFPTTTSFSSPSSTSSSFSSSVFSSSHSAHSISSTLSTAARRAVLHPQYDHHLPLSYSPVQSLVVSLMVPSLRNNSNHHFYHHHSSSSFPVNRPARSSVATRALSTLSRQAHDILTRPAAATTTTSTITKSSSNNNTVSYPPYALMHNFWQLFVASLVALCCVISPFEDKHTRGVVWSLGLDAKTAPGGGSDERTSVDTSKTAPPTRRGTTNHPMANHSNTTPNTSPTKTSTPPPAKRSSVSFFRGRASQSASSAATSSSAESTTSSLAYATVVEQNKQLLAEWEGKPYNVSARAIRGSRYTMEDEYYVGNGGRLAAVFDGHGGSGVSQYLKNHLHDVWTETLLEKHWEERDEDQQQQANHGNYKSVTLAQQQTPLSQRPSVSCHVAALRATFNELENAVLKNDDLEYQGSTAVAVVVHEGEDGSRTLLSANIGDSRAVLSRRRRAIDLTRDHKPNDEKEKARIMAMGETIEWDQDSKVHRVRNLSLARAIGDRYAKPAVSSEVEIQHFPVNEEEDEFVVLASDGLWDVMSSQAVVTYVHDYMDAELSKTSKENAESYKFVLRRNISKLLAREAMRKGSADNISVLVVWL